MEPLITPTVVLNVPAHELARSPAAARIGELATQSGLLMSHYEHRVQLEAPELWVPPDRPDLGVPLSWRAGVLPESKYLSFRHDQLIGSFHPGHRAKWTGHELCHGLVGFAWRADGTTLFHALAARLAEVLPVALWYFLDEAGLRRCPAHQGQGPLFSAFCQACEDAAHAGFVLSEHDERWVADGRAFVERELASIRRAQRDGQPHAMRYATLDLMSDGLAYAAAQLPRLRSYEMAMWVDGFFPCGSGRFSTLDALMARVTELLDDLTGGAKATPLATSRGRVIAQDVSWRLMMVVAETDGEARERLLGVVQALAADPSSQGLARTIDAYEALHDEFHLPVAADVFAVGYDLPRGYGRSIRQISEGLESVCPRALAALGPGRLAVIAGFVGADTNRRAPVARRFVDYLQRRGDVHEAASHAALEAATAHAARPDPAELTLAWDGARVHQVRRARGVELVGASPTLAVRRRTDGDVDVFEISEAAAEALRQLGGACVSRAALDLSEDELEGLEAAGLIVPGSWRLTSA